uniref:Uncharacterized protein HO-T5 n=1 Tax=Escherichia coli TaxID=562 RepID=Q7WRI5_ECOLX|nr:unknown [Escherichia coli]AAO45671.1 unknown [Escherichia coli]
MMFSLHPVTKPPKQYPLFNSHEPPRVSWRVFYL